MVVYNTEPESLPLIEPSLIGWTCVRSVWYPTSRHRLRRWAGANIGEPTPCDSIHRFHVRFRREMRQAARCAGHHGFKYTVGLACTGWY